MPLYNIQLYGFMYSYVILIIFKADYQGITLSSIAAKIYIALLSNCVELKNEKYLGRTKMSFGEIDPRRHKF